MTRLVALELRDALADFLAAGQTTKHSDLLRRFVEDLRSVPDDLEFRPAQTRPVRGLGFLAPALSQRRHPRTDRLQAAARSAIGWADWSEYYAMSGWSKPFVDRFANGDVIGPTASWRYDRLYLGLYVFGPGMTYPMHAHAAEEVYVVLSGEARFAIDADSDPVPGRSGDTIVHPSNSLHEIRTGELPVFGVYAWRGEIDGPAWYRRGEVSCYPPMLGR